MYKLSQFVFHTESANGDLLLYNTLIGRASLLKIRKPYDEIIREVLCRRENPEVLPQRIRNVLIEKEFLIPEDWNVLIVRFSSLLCCRRSSVTFVAAIVTNHFPIHIWTKVSGKVFWNLFHVIYHDIRACTFRGLGGSPYWVWIQLSPCQIKWWIFAAAIISRIPPALLLMAIFWIVKPSENFSGPKCFTSR